MSNPDYIECVSLNQDLSVAKSTTLDTTLCGPKALDVDLDLVPDVVRKSPEVITIESSGEKRQSSSSEKIFTPSPDLVDLLTKARASVEENATFHAKSTTLDERAPKALEVDLDMPRDALEIDLQLSGEMAVHNPVVKNTKKASVPPEANPARKGWLPRKNLAAPAGKRMQLLEKERREAIGDNLKKMENLKNLTVDPIPDKVSFASGDNMKASPRSNAAPPRGHVSRKSPTGSVASVGSIGSSGSVRSAPIASKSLAAMAAAYDRPLDLSALKRRTKIKPKKVLQRKRLLDSNVLDEDVSVATSTITTTTIEASPITEEEEAPRQTARLSTTFSIFCRKKPSDETTAVMAKRLPIGRKHLGKENRSPLLKDEWELLSDSDEEESPGMVESGGNDADNEESQAKSRLETPRDALKVDLRSSGEMAVHNPVVKNAKKASVASEPIPARRGWLPRKHLSAPGGKRMQLLEKERKEAIGDNLKNLENLKNLKNLKKLENLKNLTADPIPDNASVASGDSLMVSPGSKAASPRGHVSRQSPTGSVSDRSIGSSAGSVRSAPIASKNLDAMAAAYGRPLDLSTSRNNQKNPSKKKPEVANETTEIDSTVSTLKPPPPLKPTIAKKCMKTLKETLKAKKSVEKEAFKKPAAVSDDKKNSRKAIKNQKTQEKSLNPLNPPFKPFKAPKPLKPLNPPFLSKKLERLRAACLPKPIPLSSRNASSASRTIPGNTKTGPSNSMATPGNPRTSPSNSNVSPSNSGAGPSDSRTGPSESRTSPSNPRTSPRQPRDDWIEPEATLRDLEDSPPKKRARKAPAPQKHAAQKKVVLKRVEKVEKFMRRRLEKKQRTVAPRGQPQRPDPGDPPGARWDPRLPKPVRLGANGCGNVYELHQIRAFNKPELQIPKRAFQLVVKDVAKAVKDDVKFQTDAVEALQYAVEAYLTQQFEMYNLAALHARRVTVMPKDLELIRRVLREPMPAK